MGSGCFWGREYHLRRLPGVLSTSVGFAGGHSADPTYKEVCLGKTGHAEVVSVTYDHRKLPTKVLLQEFFLLHNFTAKRKSQYRSAIFSLVDDRQLAVAREMLVQLRQADYRPATEVAVAPAFYPAASRHQQYCSARGITPNKRNAEDLRQLFSADRSPN